MMNWNITILEYIIGLYIDRIRLFLGTVKLSNNY